MNSRERRIARYREKCAAEANKKKIIDKSLSGCSERTVKALSLPTPVVRDEKEVTGSYCLPQVAIFAAGHRKSESVTAR